MEVVQHYSERTKSKVSPPGVIKGDIPTPSSRHFAIRIQLPCHSTKELVDVLVLYLRVPREGHIDCPFCIRSTKAHINRGSVRHTAPNWIVLRRQANRVVQRPIFEGINGSSEVDILWMAARRHPAWHAGAYTYLRKMWSHSH